MNSNKSTYDNSKLEALFVSLWNDFCGLDNASPDTDFFASGGHSLTVMLLAARIEEDAGLTIPLAAIVRNPTPRTLATYCSSGIASTTEQRSLDGSESQRDYLIHYNSPEKQAKRSQDYERYYAVAALSSAHAEFCRRVYGADFGQHGMADLAQIDALIFQLEITNSDTILDIGCGYGQIAEYIHDRTGARVVGIDISSSAVRAGNERVRMTGKPLNFIQMDLQNIDFKGRYFNKAISIDTIYFTSDLHSTLGAIRNHGAPGFRLGVYRTFPLRSFDDQTWSPHRTQLAHELKTVFGGYRTFDYSREENQHWRRKAMVLEQLKDKFYAEGNQKLFHFRYGEAFYEAGIEQRRYLFVTDPL